MSGLRTKPKTQFVLPLPSSPLISAPRPPISWFMHISLTDIVEGIKSQVGST